jgi:hypothetical protein
VITAGRSKRIVVVNIVKEDIAAMIILKFGYTLNGGNTIQSAIKNVDTKNTTEKYKRL